MKGYFLGNMDIELYLTYEELKQIKTNKEGLTTKLENVHDSGSKRKVQLIYENLSFCDGIDVEIIREKNDFSYKVKFNDRCLQEVESMGIWGTRYGNSQKIIISTKKAPWDRS